LSRTPTGRATRNPSAPACSEGSLCSQEINMVEVKFIDGTPVPDDYLQSISLLVRDAALAIEMFREDELESASLVTAKEASVGGVAGKRCCVCGEEIIDGDESAFGACEDCLDNVRWKPGATIQGASGFPLGCRALLPDRITPARWAAVHKLLRM
jgi:hypothetical protein